MLSFYFVLVLSMKSSYALRIVDPDSRSCDPGYDAPYGTFCPHDHWTDKMVLSDSAPDKIIVNIGCNKGNDLIQWMERWDTSATFNTTKWIEYYHHHVIRKKLAKYACMPDKPFQRTKASPEGLLRKLPTGVCVEAMRGNVAALNRAVQALGYSKYVNESLHIIHGAVVKEHSPDETVDFPDGPAGTEQNAIPNLYKSQSPTRLMTVDEIVSDRNLPRVDILSIDTEGYDSDVLAGSMQTLSSVRYLEFEVHRDLPGRPWSKTTVKNVTSGLDQMGFDCYWAGNNAKLLDIKACYTEKMERGFWSNIACVRRGDIWWKDLQEFVVTK